MNKTLPAPMPASPKSKDMNPAPTTNVDNGIKTRLTASDAGVTSPKNWSVEIALTSADARPIPSNPRNQRHMLSVHC